MIEVSIVAARTRLASLVKRAQAGEVVLLTSGRHKTPVARLEAFQPTRKTRVGALETPGFVLTPAFFEPLPEEELPLWNDEAE